MLLLYTRPMIKKIRTYIKDFHFKYAHLALPIALLGGFFIDTLTLNQIDQVFDNAILITHLIIVAITISLLFTEETKIGSRILNERRKKIFQTLMALSFGSLFSGFIIFYTRSGSLVTSWPFIIPMLLLMLGTEFKKHYFQKSALQIIVFYLALLAWANFFIPVVFKKIGSLMFILGTVVSTLIIFLFIEFLRFLNKRQLKKYEKYITLRIIFIFILFNVLYFARIIPPVPLSLKFKAVYYDIEKRDNHYYAQYEKTAWYNIINKREKTMYWQQGEDIYVFTQVFAPTQIGTSIYHVWEYYDDIKRSWVESDRIEIPIQGGRQGGYRGYSKKENLSYTQWRVRTQTQEKQNLGMIRFNLIPFQETRRSLVTEKL
jgi:hypothetical protein